MALGEKLKSIASMVESCYNQNTFRGEEQEDITMLKMLREKPKWMLFIMVGVILVSIKRVFTDFDIDCEYAIAMSYRMARGDHMIAQMWEPHQTSAFFNAILIAIYLFFTGTTTGIALYLNVMGLAVKLGVAWLFYRTFRKFCDRDILFLMCAFFLTVNAKNYIILDFSNLMIYFSILLLCSLILHFQSSKQAETIFLALSAVCFCLEVLSYPSTIILFPFLLWMLYCYSGKKGRDIIVFTGICVLIGSAFLIFIVMQTGWDSFWKCAKIIVLGDDTHGIRDFGELLETYAADIKVTAVLFSVCALLSAVIVKIFLWKKPGSGKWHYARAFFVLLLFCVLMMMVLDKGGDGPIRRSRCLYSASYLPILYAAFHFRRYCGKEEGMALRIGMGISVGGFVAVLLLTNSPPLTALAYLILAVMVSMMPVGKYLCQNFKRTGSAGIYGILLLFTTTFIFRNIYLFQPASWSYATIFSIGGVVKNGPMAGIYTDYMGAYIRNSNLDDWKQYVKTGDRVLIVGYPASPIGYLYEDTEIGVDSTICTPTYNEKLLSYWEMNPWKEPNVVVLDCWFGEPHVSEDEWITEWIEDRFDCYADGRYIRVYRRE